MTIAIWCIFIDGARWQKRLVVFKIDFAARPGATLILGRLLRLGFTP